MAIKNKHITGSFIVPWPQVDGESIKTCGIEETELGLLGENKLIFGWCIQGFLTRKPNELEDHLKTIDWQRFRFVSHNFGIKDDSIGYGYVEPNDNGYGGYVTEARYRRLIRHCFISVPKEKFNHEIDKANKICQRGY